ncbi:MAG: bifunctional riboflavin kinase/FMN adenylyltransferase [Anaerolineales bacterium]|nr:bifunctional riboflavin kinase/FAD synthetase [Anaerolineae bacterium]PWB50972.1 MAG: bifunctional riboflavin kinase/FMN adenylyltransferase [Anaerolineales bacterium]
MAQHFTSLQGVNISNTWLTIGSFDGIHIGHQKLINALNSEAHGNGAKSAVLTFHPHPAVILRGRSGAFYLTTPEEKLALLDGLGVDIVITHPFTYELSQSSAREYLTYLKNHLGFNLLWVGHDFALGKGREGNIEFLKAHEAEFGYKLHVEEPVKDDGQVVSSSLIRNLLTMGNISEAGRMLGRPYQVTGVVVQGDGRGKKIGIPTANLETGTEKLIPCAGVYACYAELDGKKLLAAVNVGTRPTFENTDHLSHVEAYILDFSDDLYNRKLSLIFIERLRGEERFQSIDELLAQIHTDVHRTREILASTSKK